MCFNLQILRSRFILGIFSLKASTCTSTSGTSSMILNLETCCGQVGLSERERNRERKTERRRGESGQEKERSRARFLRGIFIASFVATDHIKLNQKITLVCGEDLAFLFGCSNFLKSSKDRISLRVKIIPILYLQFVSLFT